MNDINSVERYACSVCWSKVEVFHEFYVMVETNYRNNPNIIDTKCSINPLFDCEPEIIVDETVYVKTESDALESCVSEDKNVCIPSTSDWDSPNRLVDSFKDEDVSMAQEQIIYSKKLSTKSHETLAFSLPHKPKRKRKLAVDRARTKLKRRKLITESHLPFDESRIKKQKNIQLASLSIGEIE